MNPFYKLNNFRLNNQFDKKIVLLNKEKIYSSINTKSDKFHKKILVLNVLFFENCKDAILYTINIISHNTNF